MTGWQRRQFCVGLGAFALSTYARANTAQGASVDRILDAARRLSKTHNQPLQLLLPAGSETNLLPVIEQFQAATSVKVEISTVAVDDINTRLFLAHANGERIDLALPATYGIPDLVEANVLLDFDAIDGNVERLIGTQSLYTLGDYYDQKRFGLQTDGDVYVCFYNGKLLNNPALVSRFADKFGEPPKPASTFEELDRLIRFYHAPSEGRFGGALFRAPGYIAWEWWIRLHAKGLLPFDDQMRPQIREPQAVMALEELVELTGYLHPSVRGAGLVDNWQLFAQGNVLCNIGWGGSQKYFLANSQGFGDDLIVAPTPGGRVNGKLIEFGYFNWGWNYAVPVTSQQPKLALLFAAFATDPQISTLAVRREGFFDPFHAQHYSDPAIEKAYGAKFLSVHRKTMGNAIPDLYLRGRNQYFEILDEYLRRADRREIAPADALEVISELWDSVTDDLGRSDQIRQWRNLKKRYPAAVRLARRS